MNPSASTPATQLDLLSHVALACMQGMCAVTGIDFGGPAGASKTAFDLATVFLAERQKRLNPASSLNETGGAVSEGV